MARRRSRGLAEILAAVVLIDAIKPGHPAIHAFMSFVSDLRTGAMTGGGGEAAVASAAAAQLLNTLGLPNAGSVGTVFRTGTRVCLGYVEGRYAAVETGFTIDVYGTRCPATRHREAVYDSEHKRPRS